MNFNQLIDEVKSGAQHRIAVAAAQDADVLEALEKAQKSGLATAVLVGNQPEIEKIAKEKKIALRNFEIEHVAEVTAAVKRAIQLIRDGRAEVLMKGLCSTASLMKGVLDKEEGLRHGKLLSHLAVFETPYYHKLIFMSDAAINIAPSLEEKIEIAQNAISAVKKLGIDQPKVALITAVENVYPEKMPATTDAAIIAKMAERGQIGNAFIDGPLAVDNAFSKKSCEVKGIKSKVGGEADIAIVPNIESGNIFYKVLTYLGGSKTAGIVIGAKVPVVLTSRADSEESKFLSIATAMRLS